MTTVYETNEDGNRDEERMEREKKMEITHFHISLKFVGR
jgi:hypothetical protein